VKDKKHANAVEEFWAGVDPKLGAPEHNSYYALRDGINYLLERLPTWAVNKATTTLKDWKPR
jgi:hypothetical protein